MTDRGGRPSPVSRPRGRVFIAGGGDRSSTEEDIFESHQPPFELESDMLFVGSQAPTRGLRSRFPQTPFLSLAGATPLVLWFSRVTSLTFGPDSARQRLDAATGFGYNELNVLALLRGREAFVPVIFADSEFSRRLGLRYGMPKKRIPVTFRSNDRRVESAAVSGAAESRVSARLLASGRLLKVPFDIASPWWSWPVSFPGGSFIRARIGGVPRAQIAQVSGTLALEEEWLPEPVRLWPLGVFVPGLRMKLPAPELER